MIKFHCLALLAASVASSPIEILNYKDEEAGHGQVMSGTPGEAVMGEFHWKAPEGDAIRLVYTADMDGYVATGEHLPVSPDLTPEVMEARAAFMDKFDEAKAQAMEEEIMEDIAAVEIAEEIMEEKALGLRSDEPSERRRRDAEADAQVFMTQPLHYAPSYPYYFVQNGVELKQVEEESMENMDVPMKVEDMDEMKMTDLDSKKIHRSPELLPPPWGSPPVCPLLLLSLTGPVPHRRQDHRDPESQPLVPGVQCPVSLRLPRPRFPSRSPASPARRGSSREDPPK